MKRLILSLFILGALSAHAQTPFATRDSVSINKINAMVLVHGDMWWNPAIAEAHCYFPAGTHKSISSAGALWMSAYDAGSQLHVAAQTYRQAGNDYWPGPLDAADTLTWATSQSWAKIWKVNRSDIQYFRSLTSVSPSTVPAAIWTWPAKGNVNAAGNGGAPLSITGDMAPFIDINGDGIYNPLLGDYPDVKGDQALWWVFSDNGPTHNESNGKPLGVEVHAMAYGYSRGTAIDNVIYYEYTVHNRSANNYTNFRIGQLADMDLGGFEDDYMGIDTIRALAYVYNADATDGQYGTSLPVAGLLMLRAGTPALMTGAGSFMYYNNDASGIGNPTAPAEYNNYLRATFRDGTHAVNDYSAPGTMAYGTTTGPATNFVFHGDLSNAAQWSECQASNVPGDRRMVFASRDMALAAGGTATMVMAMVTTDPGPNHTCGTMQSIDDLIRVADTARSIFDVPLPAAVSDVDATTVFAVYPSPARSRLYIAGAVATVTPADVAISNVLGQSMDVHVVKDGGRYTADISALPAGLYFVRIKSGAALTTIRFLKE